jgi:23S rRNA (uracil747-C5)-methyltransferase
MRCPAYDAGRCRSCTLLEVAYDAQLAGKAERAAALVPGEIEWLPPVASPEEGFRNKAKMVVAGTVGSPTIGILDADGHGVDLRACGLHEPRLRAALPALAAFVTAARLAPYDVATRRGELKHLIVTRSPDDELMVRWVLRSTEAEARVRKHLPGLLAEVPAIRVVSLNVQPEHKAVLEGEREIVLTDADTLPMRVNGLTLHLAPQSFFQTNTAVAAALYREAAAWTADLPAASVLDLYSGVGGFALHLAGPGRAVVGVESSAQAVRSARGSAAEAGVEAEFVVEDATAYLGAGDRPDLVVVNPPRRGLGDALAGRLEVSGVPHVLYSSCNPDSLARDLARMPSLRPVRGRVFDMFPQTAHAEVLVLLART